MPFPLLALQSSAGNRAVEAMIVGVQRRGPDSDCGCEHEEAVQRAVPAAVFLQRVCLPAAQCGANIAGGSERFGQSVDSQEDPARRRRKRMAPGRQHATGHLLPARQLERFFITAGAAVHGGRAGALALLSRVHGIFVDQDQSADVSAESTPCSDTTPPVAGAPPGSWCVLVPGALNQQALTFNRTQTGGGTRRQAWKAETLRTLTHEIQHAVYGQTSRPVPVGVAPACDRATVDWPVSELTAMMSEFPVTVRSIPPGTPPAQRARILGEWFTDTIINRDESIQGAVTELRCACDCADADAYIRDTFAFTAASWTAAERNAFNTVLRQARWGLSWPL